MFRVAHGDGRRAGPGRLAAYRLLPASARAIILSTSVARALLVGSAAVLQLALAWGVYRTPWPAHPAQLALAFGAVCFAFLGVGLVIAMLADNVPAVQAIGQCVFLPMIMIGGVGCRCAPCRRGRQHVAGFLPGRYAVAALDACIVPEGVGPGGGEIRAGRAGCDRRDGVCGGLRLVPLGRGSAPAEPRGEGWLGLALTAWVLVGLLAGPGRAHPQPPVVSRVARSAKVSAAPTEPWQEITEADIAAIPFDDLPPDDGYYVPVARSLDGLDADAKSRLDSIEDALAYWPPGREGPLDQRVRDLLSVCAVADLTQDENEGEIALVVFGQIRDAIPAPALARVLAWIILHPAGGKVRLDVSEFGIKPAPVEAVVRERCAAYAKKLALAAASPEFRPARPFGWTTCAKTGKLSAMKSVLPSLLLAALGLTGSFHPALSAADAPVHKILVFTKSSGFEHSVIKETAGGSPATSKKC